MGVIVFRLLFILIISLPTLSHATGCEADKRLDTLVELPPTAAPHSYRSVTSGVPSFLDRHEEDVAVPAVLDKWGNVLIPTTIETRVIPSLFHGGAIRIRLSEGRSGGNSGTLGYALLEEDGASVCHFSSLDDYTDWRYAHLRPDP